MNPSASSFNNNLMEGSLLSLLKIVWTQRDSTCRDYQARPRYNQLKRLWRFVKPHARTGLVACLLTIAGTLLAAPQPLLSKFLVDEVMYRGRIHLLLPLIALLVALILVGTVVGFRQTVGLTRFQLMVMTDIQKAMFSRIVKLPKSFFDSKQTGYLMSRIIQDTVRLQSVLSGNIVQILPQILLMPLAVILLGWLNWRLTVVLLVLAPVLAYVSRYTAIRARMISAILMERGAQVYRELSSALSAVSLIKAFATEARECDRFTLRLRESAESGLQQRVLSTSVSLLLSLGGSTAIIVCTWLGVWDVHLSRMTVGDYIAFFGYIGYLLGPLNVVATIHVELQSAMVALERVVELLEAVPEDADDDRKAAIEAIRGVVEVRDVCFSYDGNRGVLSNVSFTALPGQVVAIVGPSGSGKSTLVSLLIRLYRPSSGRILIDGHDVEGLKLKPLRERIGIVSQDVLLLDDTVLNNIRYGTPDATVEQVQHAARLACAEEFILGFPDGYHTIVGERGVKLSAGERQRISLARVLVKDPDIVILDEPTAALDSSTEAVIKRALSVCLAKKTTFVVAHRLSTVLSADKILVLADGHILQEGTHADLSRQEGLYRRMCEEQKLIQRFGDEADRSTSTRATPGLGEEMQCAG